MAILFTQLLRSSVITPRLRLSVLPSVLRLYSSSNAAGVGGSGSPSNASSTGAGSSTPPSEVNKDALQQLVRTNKVVIFMKGNPEAPRCGFSNAVVQILRMHGVQYDAHDVLLNDNLRQGIKEFTEWPTIPQVFINGDFVGGCDILMQMHQSGDLIEELKKVGIESLLLKQATETEAKKAEATDGNIKTPVK